MAKKILITQSDYIPWKGYFDAINTADVLVLYDEMQYTKRDWRNRNKIKTANGTTWLSIPVKVKDKYFQKINETEVVDQKWRKKHWNSIVHNYSKSPFFKAHSASFKKLYEDEGLISLSQINRAFIEEITSILEINIDIKQSKEFKLEGNRTEKLLDICKELQATHYISGPSAKNYMDTSLFEDANIEIIWMDYSGYPEYPQQFEGFEHEVSILDLVF